MPLCFGLFTLVVTYWLASALFESRRAGLFASACVAADGFFIVYSRAGLLDGMLACLVLWALLAAVVARSWRGVLASALLVGLATSVKWSGVTAAVPAAAAVWLLGRVPRSTVGLFAVVPLVHAAVWMGGLGLTREPWDPRSLWALAANLFHHHQGRGVEDHGLASPWYSWPFLYQPLVMKESHPGPRHRLSATVGNLSLWAAATATVFATPLIAIGSAASARVRSYVPGWIERALAKNALLLFLGWLALLFPWMIGRGRLTFIYHYLPSYGFALALLGGGLAEVERRHTRAVVVFFVLVLLVAIYYVPVWGELPISTKAMHFRLPFQHWRP